VKKQTIYLLAALAGLLGGFSFPPVPIGLIAFLVFVPLIILLERKETNQNTVRLLYVFFFFFHGAANWWVMSWQKETDPFLMIAGAALWLGHAYFLMPAFLLYKYIRKRTSVTVALCALPFLWTSVEWLHSLGDFSYPWLAVGYTQTYNTYLIQLADITGVWGISFIVMLVNCVIAHWWLTRKSISMHIGLIAGVFVLMIGYSFVTISSLSVGTVKQRGVTFGVVQPNIDPWAKWKGETYEMIGKHINLQDSLNKKRKCDISVWSETAIPIGLLMPQYSDVRAYMQKWADTSGTALLTGFADWTFYPEATAPFNARPYPLRDKTKYRVFNSAGMLIPKTEDVPVHHKSKLTPFGEGVPFSDDLPFLQNILQWGVGISGWNKGEGANALPIVVRGDTVKIGPVICIESIYPNFVADYARNGANVLAVITNDAWYDGTFGPEQHYCIARMRAVESHRYIVRCGNSGVSGFISATGESIEQAQTRTPLALHGTVPLLTTVTLYMEFGDWLPIGCTLLMIASIVWVWWANRKTTILK